MAPICSWQHLRRTPAICDNDGIIYLADLKTWHFVDEELDPVLRTVMRSLEDHTLPCLWGLVCPVAPTMLELAFSSRRQLSISCAEYAVTLQNNSCLCAGAEPSSAKSDEISAPIVGEIQQTWADDEIPLFSIAAWSRSSCYIDAGAYCGASISRGLLLL